MTSVGQFGVDGCEAEEPDGPDWGGQVGVTVPIGPGGTQAISTCSTARDRVVIVDPLVGAAGVDEARVASEVVVGRGMSEPGVESEVVFELDVSAPGVASEVVLGLGMSEDGGGSMSAAQALVISMASTAAEIRDLDM